MKNLVAPIDTAGRIVLPKEVRDELAIKPGDVFRVSTIGGAVTLTPHRAKAGFVRKGKALVFTSPGSATMTVEQVNEVLESSRDESLQRSIGLAARPRSK